MPTYNPEGARVYEKGEGYETGRIKGEWEDVMRSLAPNDNERGWNQAAQMAVADGHINTHEEAKQAADWLKNQSDPTPQAPAEPEIVQTPPIDSPHLAEAKERVQNWEKGVEIGQSSHEIFGQGNNNNTDFTNERFVTYQNSY